MPKKRGVRVVLMVEDEALERLARQTLLELGFARRELSVIPYPVGTGSAKDWVDSQDPIEVGRMRSKSYQQVGILVATDADQLTVQQRHSQLDAALISVTPVPRAAGERIALWIPRWNVETWLLHFAGDTRSETVNHKHDCKSPDFVAGARAFVGEYRRRRQGQQFTTLPSLVDAYYETVRLD